MQKEKKLKRRTSDSQLTHHIYVQVDFMMDFLVDSKMEFHMDFKFEFQVDSNGVSRWIPK